MSTAAPDPELLRAFVAVAERLSFTRAADALNRTQAAVSVQIKRLEALLGVTLLHRSTTRVSLSAAGESFLRDARKILTLNEQAVARVAGHRLGGRVRIGVMEDYGTRILPRLLADAGRDFPLLHVEMEIGLTATMLGRLGSAFDIVIAMHAEGATDEGTFICRETPAWAASPQHASEESDPLPVALSDAGCLFRDWAVQALDAAGRPWRLAYVSRSQAAVEAIVAQGLAITVLKRGLCGGGLRIIAEGAALPPLPKAEIRLHRAPNLPPAATLFADRLCEGVRAATAVWR